MLNDAYPRWRKGLLRGAAFGLIAASTWFLLCYWMAAQPAILGSPSMGFQPWWRFRNWCGALILFALIGEIVTLRVALIPGVRSRQR